MLLNLAINAGEAMPGGGAVRISTRNALITGKPHMGGVDARGGRYVVLAVSDEGEGMSAETKARAFEPFFTTKANGSGLGLATVYGIISQSDGFVHIYSQPSQGSIVEVWLPCLDVGADGVCRGAGGGPERGAGGAGRRGPRRRGRGARAGSDGRGARAGRIQRDRCR